MTTKILAIPAIMLAITILIAFPTREVQANNPLNSFNIMITTIQERSPNTIVKGGEFGIIVPGFDGIIATLNMESGTAIQTGFVAPGTYTLRQTSPSYDGFATSPDIRINVIRNANGTVSATTNRADIASVSIISNTVSVVISKTATSTPPSQSMPLTLLARQNNFSIELNTEDRQSSGIIAGASYTVIDPVGVNTARNFTIEHRGSLSNINHNFRTPVQQGWVRYQIYQTQNTPGFMPISVFYVDLRFDSFGRVQQASIPGTANSYVQATVGRNGSHVSITIREARDSTHELHESVQPTLEQYTIAGYCKCVPSKSKPIDN